VGTGCGERSPAEPAGTCPGYGGKNSLSEFMTACQRGELKNIQLQCNASIIGIAEATPFFVDFASSKLGATERRNTAVANWD
jgi:hypothetical protein